MPMMKYAITTKSQKVTIKGRERTVYQIMAVKDFVIEVWNNNGVFTKKIHAGDLGGYIETVKNLSQEGTCWVANGSIVCDNAVVVGDAYIGKSIIIADSVRVTGKAKISKNCELYDFVEVTDNAIICGFAKLCGRARVSGNAYVVNTSVADDVEITDEAYIYSHKPHLSGNKKISGNTRLIFRSLVVC